MVNEDIEALSNSAAFKVDLCNNHFGRYFMRAIIAGFFIVVAVILSNVTAAVIYPASPQAAKVIGALVFPISIILVVLFGGELFTGNNMTMAIGAYNKRCSVKDVIKIWVISYLGNIVGTVVLSSIFVWSGASKQILTDYFNTFIDAKLAIDPLQMFLRAVMCNFLVCLAVYSGTRLKTECGKIIVEIFVIMAFVIAGFEHCVANMSIFTIAAWLKGGLDVLAVLKSMLIVTLGNIIGGAVLLALPLKLASAEK